MRRVPHLVLDPLNAVEDDSTVATLDVVEAVLGRVDRRDGDGDLEAPGDHLHLLESSKENLEMERMESVRGFERRWVFRE